MRTLLLSSLLLLTAACTDPAKDKVKATVSTPTPAQKAEAPAPVAGVPYGFSQADSKVLWTGAKITGKHEGGFNTFSGTFEVVGGDVSKSRVTADIDMGSLFCDSEKLTGHLKSPDFFGVEQFPTAKFVSSAFTKSEEGKFQVTGDLTLHGVTKTLTFPASITVTAEEATVSADFAINRKDFGIVYPGKPDDLIADNVALKLELHAKKK
jgi:polyisoprenoid-binding protein YceI